MAAPTAGLHFTEELLARLKERGIGLAQGHAARRRRHLPAGEGRRHRRAHACMPSSARSRRRRRTRSMPCAPKAGASWPSARPRCALLESAAGEDGRLQAVFRRDRDLHHAGLPIPRRRPDADQFPPAALDLVHAGRGLQRARHHAARLCARDRGRLSLLFLRRRVSALSCRPMSEPFSFQSDQDRRRRAPRRNHHAAWQGADAGLHAGRHAGDREGPDAGRRARDRRRDRARQHLSPDAAARRRAHRGARRPAQVHELAAADPHRFRRLPGDVAVRAAQDRRTRRDVPLASRRRHGRAFARARDRDPGAARRRHFDAARRVPEAARLVRGDRARDAAVAALGRALASAPSRAARTTATRCSASCRAATISRCAPRAPARSPAWISRAMPSAGLRSASRRR